MPTHRLNKPSQDFSKFGGENPTKILTKRADKLFSIEDPQALANELRSIIGGGGAGKGAEKYLRTIDAIMGVHKPQNKYQLYYVRQWPNPLEALQKFMSDYIIRGSGISEWLEVSEETEIVLDGQRYLLEVGDRIMSLDEAKKKQKLPKEAPALVYGKRLLRLGTSIKQLKQALMKAKVGGERRYSNQEIDDAMPHLEKVAQDIKQSKKEKTGAVSEDVEVTLGNEKYLLEEGDEIRISS